MIDEPVRETCEVQANGFVIVQPLLEPKPWKAVKLGPIGAFAYVRWSSLGVGVDFLPAGIAVWIGPIMIGFGHIQRMDDAFDAAEEAQMQDAGL